MLRIARETAAGFADSELRWQYLAGHQDWSGLVRACVNAIKADREERRRPQKVSQMQEGDPIGWVERG